MPTRYPPCCRCNPPAAPYQYCARCRNHVGRMPSKETVYAGYRMRSRLEARWAVFFDSIGVPWEYERQDVTLPDGTRYLPDFWLPKTRDWGEVKPEAFSAPESDRCRELCRLTGSRVWEFVGLPQQTEYYLWALEPVGLGGAALPKRTISRLVADREEGAIAYQKARSARFEFGEMGSAVIEKEAHEVTGRRFLDHIPQLQRSLVSNIFLNTIRGTGGATTADDVLAGVRRDLIKRRASALRYQGAWTAEEFAKIQTIDDALGAHEDDARNYAEYLLWYESLPYSTRQRMKGVNGELYWARMRRGGH